MDWLRRGRKTADEADLERLRALYAALGPGFPTEAKRVFEDQQPGDGAGTDWCLSYNGHRERCLQASDLSNGELFAMPPAWELMRVTVSRLSGRLTRRGEFLDVAGHLVCRPRGSWETMRLPFLHHWTLRDGQVTSFESLLDGIELCRAGSPAGSAAA